MKKEILIGAHTSTAGGLHNALLEGKEIGATTIQLFTRNQRQWQAKPLENQEIDKWKKTLEETGIKKIMCHDSYLINLASPKSDTLEKSRKAFHEEILRCLALDISFLTFHPGSATDGDAQAGLDRIVESLIQTAPLLEKGNLRLLLESTAGQGNVLGWQFEQLAYVLDRVSDIIPSGICLDTCHSFTAGYDIRNEAAIEETLAEFDNTIGLKHLRAFHFNDSMKEFGTRKDRHANIGEGFIGEECFKILMHHPKTRDLPKYLETPGGPERWTEEIAMLKKYY